MFYIFAVPYGHFGYLGMDVSGQEVLRSFPRYDNAYFYTSSLLNTPNLYGHFPRSDQYTRVINNDNKR